MAGPLDGVRVIDLTTTLMGPVATQILGDQGADVIKVESPAGDLTRDIGPMRNPRMGFAFLNLNRSKRSLVLDLKRPAGREALLRLVATADVLVHAMRPASMTGFGLGWEDCRACNPRLVYCGAYGYHEDGPYAGRPAYDDAIQALTGMAALQAELVGEPRYLPTVVVDKAMAQIVAYAIAMALFRRERTGEGQCVDVAMFEAMAGFMLTEHIAGMLFDPPLGPPGYARALAPHRRPYRVRDGHVCVLPYTTAHWRRFFRLVGRDDMVDDLRVTDAAQRAGCIAELYTMVGEAVRDWSSAELLQALTAEDIPCAPVNALADLLNDPHLQATGFFRRFQHPSEGALMDTAIPVRFGTSPAGVPKPAPRLGEHSLEILREAGYAPAEIEALVESGVTQDGSA